MKPKLRKELTKIAEGVGLKVEDIWTRGGNHIAIRASNGKEARTFTASPSPSCRRGRLNLKSDMRRFFREGLGDIGA